LGTVGYLSPNRTKKILKKLLCDVQCGAKTWPMELQRPAWLYATIPSYSVEIHNEDIMITLSKLMIYLLKNAWWL